MVNLPINDLIRVSTGASLDIFFAEMDRCRDHVYPFFGPVVILNMGMAQNDRPKSKDAWMQLGWPIRLDSIR